MNKKMRYKNGTVFREIWKAKGCYIALLPTFLFLFIFSLYPAFEGIIKSCYRWKTSNYFNPVFNGTDNFVKLFRDEDFWVGFGVLFIIQVAGFITTFGVNLSITYLIFRMRGTKRGGFFQRAFVIPIMIPGMVITLFWRFFYMHDTGVLDSILSYLGVEHKIIWLADYKWTLPAMLFKGFPWAGGLTMLLLLAGMLNIDTSLEESARIDGANAFDIFKKIYLPLLIPQIKVISIMGMIGGLQSYSMQLVYTNGAYNTMTPPYYMYKTAFMDGNYGYASAQGVVLFVIILIITILQQKFVNRVD